MSSVSTSLFISYSHDDVEYIRNFIKHFRPLIEKQEVSIWYDRENHPGSDFQEAIDRNIDASDIICLFISASFLDSSSCKKERVQALDLEKSQDTSVIPIIVRNCGWQDVPEISGKLALPEDGHAVTTFSHEDDAWNNVYEHMKIIISEKRKVNQIEKNDEYRLFLSDTGFLEKAHANKEKLLLDDIYIFPDLVKNLLSDDSNVTIRGEKIVDEFFQNRRVVISGESQSGKTSLAKQIIGELTQPKFFGVYVRISSKNSKGLIKNAIESAIREEYSSDEDVSIPTCRIVPIIDDFHKIHDKDRAIEALKEYSMSILVVDDIFSLNLRDEMYTREYCHYRIKEYSPSLRSCLLEKWQGIGERVSPSCNDRYEKHDKFTELIDTALGKIIGNGIVPAYPFYILSIISTSEAMGKPLDQDITSQGYCYQALIYLYLRREGVQNDDFDTYINFLTEFAAYIFKEKKPELSRDEFEAFLDGYHKRFHLVVPEKTLLTQLEKTGLIQRDGLNNYSFTYVYIYYFFAAKNISENQDENRGIIDSIVHNLHKNENAYIAIFISHHSKDMYLLDEIIVNAFCLFDAHSPATLTSAEIGFFDDQVDHILQASLPPVQHSPEKARASSLKVKDQIEELDRKKSNSDDAPSNDLEVELRRAIKTVEVMGRIIKNRAGSLEKEKLELIFESAMDVHLRVLSSFFSLISSPKDQDELVEYLVDRMKSKISVFKEKEEKKGRNFTYPDDSELKEMASKLFWGLNFGVVYGVVHKIVHSLGSDKLIAVVDAVCDKRETPASFLIKHGIYMWYRKNLRLDDIKKKIDEDGFSYTGIRVLNYLVVEHCTLHGLKYDERQKVESKLGLSSRKLLQAQSRKK